jgi:hypothetical protein
VANLTRDDIRAIFREEHSKTRRIANARYDFEQEPVFRKYDHKTGQTLEYPLHEGQRQVWRATESDVAAIAGTRSGKTALGPWLILREIQRNGGGDALIVGPNFPLMDRRLVPECIAIWQHLLGMGEYKAGRRCFVFSDMGLAMLGVKQAAVWFGFAEDPETLESMEAVCAWCDEAGQSKFSREAIEAIRRRVSFSGTSGKAGRIFYTSTPYAFNWFKSDIYDKAFEPDSGIKVVNYVSTDNPLFPKEEWDRMEKLLPRWKFDMMYRGIFTRPLGQVFTHFNPDRHVIKPFNIPWHWKRAQGADFGEVNTASLKAARNPETEQWVLYWDYHAGKIPVEDHVAAWNHGVSEDEEKPWCWGGAPSEDNWRDQFNWAGYYIMKPPTKDRFVGIQQLNSMFANDELLIFDTCVRTIKQLQEMSYEISAETGEVNPAKIEKESEYHLCAAARYMATGIAQGLGEAQVASAYSF